MEGWRDFPIPQTSKEQVISPDQLIESGPAVLDLTDIKVREAFNPRDDAAKADIETLAKSIKQRGLLQPLIVTPNDSGYYLVDGHRRFLACQKAGLRSVAVSVRPASDETEQLIDAVTANVQRQDLTVVEEAKAFQRMRDQGKSARQIGSELGVSAKLVTNRLSILTLPAVAQSLIESGDIQPGHIPTLVEMAKVSPGLAGAIAMRVVERQIGPAKFAAEPFAQVAQGFVPEIDVWIVGTPAAVVLSTVKDDLTELDQARLKEIGELGGSQTPNAITIEIEPGVAYGAVYVPPHAGEWDSKVAVVDRAWMKYAVQKAILDLVNKRRAQKGATQETPNAPKGDSAPPVDEEAQKAAKRLAHREELEQRLKTHAMNLNLGAELFTGLAKVELTHATACLIARLVLAQETRQVFLAGMQFCDPKRSKEVASKGDSPARIEYDLVGDSTAQEKYVVEFIERGDTGEHVLGRLLQVLGMASLADQSAVARSNRPGTPNVARRARDEIAGMLGHKLPVPIRQRLDEEADLKRIEAEQRDKRAAETAAKQKAFEKAEDESIAAVLKEEDTEKRRVLAIAHIDEFGDPDGTFEAFLEDSSVDDA